MRKGQVIVTISGHAGSGKSAIARILEEALKAINVEYAYDDSGDYTYLPIEREQINSQRTHEQAKQIASERIQVVIQERQLHRGAKPIVID